MFYCFLCGAALVTATQVVVMFFAGADDLLVV